MNVDEWTAALTDSVTRVAQKILEYLPNILGSLILFFIGWLVANLLRSATLHIMTRAMQRLSRSRPIQNKVQDSQSYQSVPMVTSRVVYWTVLLFFLAAAVEALGLAAVSNVLGLVTAYLPRILAGILIMFVGLWAGEFVRTFLGRAAARAGIAQGDVLGRVAQGLVIIVMIIIAVDQIGIDSTVLVMTMITVFAATFGAAALAFGLGARSTVANIIASRYIQRSYRDGDVVKIGELQGRVVEITATAVILDTEDGRVLIPAERFNQDTSVLLRKET